MDDEQLKTERSGFKNFLWILFIGISLVGLIDFFFRKMTVGFVMPIAFLVFCILFSLVLLNKKFWRQFAFISLVVAIGIFLIVRALQGLAGGDSLMLVLILAFLGSVLLKGRVRITVHSLIVAFCIILIAALVWNAPVAQADYWGAIRGTLIFITIYASIAYPTAFIQDWLDRERATLRMMNDFLQKENSEKDIRQAQLLEAQNQIQRINQSLEAMVGERTKKLSDKNKHLADLSFQNAHLIRGPLARILGLINLANIEGSRAYPILIPKIHEQAKEMDEAVKRIGIEINHHIDEPENGFKDYSV